MFNCTDFNSLSVLSIYEGELLGVVDKLYFDKKLRKLIELELIGTDGAKLILPTKNIYHIGKNAITVKNNQMVNLKVNDSEFCLSPISSKAYSLSGEYLGIIKEISFNDKYLTEKIALDNDKTLNVSELASCGKNTVIFYEANNNVDVKKFMPSKNTPKKYKTANVQQAEIQPIQTDEAKQEEKPKEQPAKQTFSAEFLLGRVCTKDIFNFNNEILIKAHTVVNKKNLKEINKFGKLRELMLYSK